MTESVLEGIWVFTGQPIRVEADGAEIVSVSEAADPYGRLPFLAPGLFDLQVNGLRGVDYSSSELKIDQVDRVVEALSQSGTTRHLPTIITSPRGRIVANLALLEQARARSPRIAAAIPGYHIEGPFISAEEGPRGAHSRRHVRLPDFDEFQEWQEAAAGRVRIVTLAPELPGAIPFIERVARTGVVVAIGHSAATPETIRDAVSAGARMSTHLGNGSHAVLPRLSNYLWEQLAADELSAGIICDGYHLPDPVVKVFARAKGLERLILVSDVAIHAGRAPGVYPWQDATVEVHPDGHLGLHGTEYLAGAGHLLDRGVARFIRATGVSPADAVRLCTVQPDRLLGGGMPDLPRPGDRADLMLFHYRPGDDSLTVLSTLRSGELVHHRPVK